jgi:hypothetical protein
MVAKGLVLNRIETQRAASGVAKLGMTRRAQLIRCEINVIYIMNEGEDANIFWSGNDRIAATWKSKRSLLDGAS